MLIVEEAAFDATVSINAPVAQERPVAAHVFDAFDVDFADENLFSINRAFSDNDAEWVSDKRGAPELDARATRRILVADAIDCRDVDAISNRVSPLNGAPRIALLRAELILLVRMPADGRWIEKDVRAAQSREPCAFGIPLIPANQGADATDVCIEGA